MHQHAGVLAWKGSSRCHRGLRIDRDMGEVRRGRHRVVERACKGIINITGPGGWPRTVGHDLKLNQQEGK